MVVKIVTDSGADFPEGIVNDLGIVVVPLHILFGNKDYLDRVDIVPSEIYRKLSEGSAQPTTSAASLGEIFEVYKKLSEQGADSILSIHISQKLSSVYSNALHAKEFFETSFGKVCQIEVIDSETIAAGTGFLAMLAAESAKEGKSLQEIASLVRKNIPLIHVIGSLDTMKYLVKGGRAPKIALAAGPLKIRTFICLKDGEIHLLGMARTQQKKTEKFLDFVGQFAKKDVELVIIEYTDNLEEAKILKERIESKVTGKPVYLIELGATLGVHAGPGTMALGVKKWK